ncbi:unnamed protein product [Dovyalis caffra]|uniref:Uncharacterized protein n=1 Tax=Dovyalis caffra TaxID=77055 RepID=A0AAV1S795_9ROSI|nr:unnamed protein product [Dovyalis caffra]
MAPQARSYFYGGIHEILNQEGRHELKRIKQGTNGLNPSEIPSHNALLPYESTVQGSDANKDDCFSQMEINFKFQ